MPMSRTGVPNTSIPPIESSQVRGAMERIANSPSFRRAPRLRALLEFSVSQALNEDSITERMVANHLFGRGMDFDPALDPTVRVHYGRLRRRLEGYFANEGASDAVRIRIPHRCYTPVFVAGPAHEQALNQPLNQPLPLQRDS